MIIRRPTSWQKALRGIALGLCWAQAAAGQSGAPDAGAGACTPSPEPHACAERCPSFDTCYIEDDSQLYYRVMGERFDCDGLDCEAASARLGDYCCERGEYAPARRRDGSGEGCALATASAAPQPSALATGTWLAALALLLIRRRSVGRAQP